MLVIYIDKIKHLQNLKTQTLELYNMINFFPRFLKLKINKTNYKI